MTGLRWWKPPRPSLAAPPQAWQVSSPAPPQRGHSSRCTARLCWTTFLPEVLVPRDDTLRCHRPGTQLCELIVIACAAVQAHLLPSAVDGLLDGLRLWADYQGDSAAHSAAEPCLRACSVWEEVCERSHRLLSLLAFRVWPLVQDRRPTSSKAFSA
jgi:hypothetical protein